MDKRTLLTVIAISFILAIATLSAASGDKDKALSNKDRFAIVNSADNALDNVESILASQVEVEKNNSLSVWVVPIAGKTDEDNQSISLQMTGALIALYANVDKEYPGIDQMNVYLGAKGDELGSMYCTKDNIKQVIWTGDDLNITSTFAPLETMIGTFKKF